MKAFYITFLSVLGITLLCGGVAVLIAFFGGDVLSPAQERVLSAMTDLMKLGAGAIFGMFGGKAALSKPN